MWTACGRTGEPFFFFLFFNFPANGRQQRCQEDKGVISKAEARGKKIWKSDAYPLMNLANNAHILPYTRKCTLKWASRRKGGKKVSRIHTSAVGGVWYVKLVRPNPTEWPCWDGVKQLCVMRQCTEREHLSEHQGEASGYRSITKALHHDKNTAVILVWNEAALFSYSLTRPRSDGGGGEWE